MNRRNEKLLHLIIAESSLELIPAEIAKEPDVVKSAKRRNKPPQKILLDISLHYNAMRKLKKREKRGRPDIIHFTLLTILETPLVHRSITKIYIHTIDNKVIFVRPDVRLPKNYNRFVGLMEQLLDKGKVPPGSNNPLLWVKHMSLSELLSSINPAKVLIFTERGENVSLDRLIEEIVWLLKRNMEVAVIVGGFPHGDFEKETLKLGTNVSIYSGKPMKTWHIVCRLTTLLEKKLDLF